MLLIITFCASYLLLWQHSPAPSLIQIVCGLWMADFGGGLVHLYLDTFIAFHLPVLGPLAAEFQQHHKAPHEITRRTTLGLLTDTSVFFPLPFFWWLLLPVSTRGCGTVFCAAAWLTQVVHRSAHGAVSKNVWSPLALLQRCGLILSQRAHAEHHDGTFDQNYAIFNGWSNPVLNMLCKLARGGVRVRGEDAY